MLLPETRESRSRKKGSGWKPLPDYFDRQTLVVRELTCQGPEGLVELLPFCQACDRPRAIAPKSRAIRAAQVTIAAPGEMLLHDIERGPEVTRRVAVAHRRKQLLRRECLHDGIIRRPAQRCRPPREFETSRLRELHRLPLRDGLQRARRVLGDGLRCAGEGLGGNVHVPDRDVREVRIGDR